MGKFFEAFLSTEKKLTPEELIKMRLRSPAELVGARFVLPRPGRNGDFGHFVIKNRPSRYWQAW